MFSEPPSGGKGGRRW